MTGATCFLPVRDYDLAITLDSGQAFRWKRHQGHWEGVIGRRWVRLRQEMDGVAAQTVEPVPDWNWLREYLQTEVDLGAILATFPDDEPMRASVRACHGLRLLRQDPWECLASFILSSTKQIVQIRQIVELLCVRFGEPVSSQPPIEALSAQNGPPPDTHRWFTFPAATRLAACSEAELRACKMGFRAPHLLGAARAVAAGELDLPTLPRLDLDQASQELTRLRGVGEKIAHCVLLFAYGFPTAFPVDVWIERALHELYFPWLRPTPKRLRQFVRTHFGPHSGYAQQYLFQAIRAKNDSRSQACAGSIPDCARSSSR